MPAKFSLLQDLPRTQDQHIRCERLTRSKAPFVVFLLGAFAVFGTILWSANGPSVSQRVEAPDDAKQLRDEWKRQRDSIQEALKNIQDSQQRLAGEMDNLKRQIAREGGERKQLSDQVGSLSARVDGLYAANANAAESVRKRR